MKRRNRITLNFLSPNLTGRKKKYKISKEVIYSRHSAKDKPENYVDEDDYINEDNFSINDELEDVTTTTAHTKRKLRLSEKWMEIRENAYRVMINRHALQREIECFACSSIATTRCTLCGPYLMCLECCYITHKMCNFHHCPEVWKVCKAVCMYTHIHTHTHTHTHTAHTHKHTHNTHTHKHTHIYRHTCTYIYLHAYIFKLMQDNCFVPLELPPIDFPITTHTCETVHNRLVTCFHIEGWLLE